LFAVALYTALGIVALAFIFSNRTDIVVQIPLLAQVDAPLYALLALTFGFGLLIGLSYAALLSFASLRRERRQRRTITALEKEVAVRDAATLSKP
jgi:uncharacterized membrane protein YciS (DUF1049 family)